MVPVTVTDVRTSYAPFHKSDATLLKLCKTFDQTAVNSARIPVDFRGCTSTSLRVWRSDRLQMKYQKAKTTKRQVMWNNILIAVLTELVSNAQNIFIYYGA